MTRVADLKTIFPWDFGRLALTQDWLHNFWWKLPWSENESEPKNIAIENAPPILFHWACS